MTAHLRRTSARPTSLVFPRLLEVVRKIPRGHVATYGQVAALAGLPRHARHVGYALHALADGSPLPWHRVVGAGGAIRLRRVDGAWTQRMRLEREGVTFTPRGRVWLERFAWRPGRASRRRPASSAPASSRRRRPSA
jgi:methylated-DNA-protein-cysteine methyltransferase-like protein